MVSSKFANKQIFAKFYPFYPTQVLQMLKIITSIIALTLIHLSILNSDIVHQSNPSNQFPRENQYLFP